MKLCRVNRVVVSITWVGLFLFSVHAAENPKYIFLMIGDGMGAVQRETAEIYKKGKICSAPEEEKGKLVMNRFPVKGLTTTHSLSGVTDSSAAITALACGKKTQNQIISMLPDSKTGLKSVAYYAKDSGMKVGVVASVPLDHATPGGIYACEPNRKNYYNIAIQAAQSGFDYFGGCPFAGSQSRYVDGRKSPLDCAKEAGYSCYKGREGLKRINAGDDKVIWEAKFPFVIDGQSDDITLAELTRKGIEVLDNENGFFMMVEGGKIDFACHANDLSTAIKETLSFDDAVAEAYAFYKKHSAETLIVVTADHETGGMSLMVPAEFSRAQFVAAVDAQQISGGEFARKTKKWTAENITEADALQKTVEYFGLEYLTDEERSDLSRVVGDALKYKTVDSRPEEIKKMYGSKNILASGCQAIVAKRCGVLWSTSWHSAAAVLTTAIGFGAERFGGSTDNTDIAKNLIELVQ